MAGTNLKTTRQRLPSRRDHTPINIEASGFGAGHYDDSWLAETLLTTEKAGTAIDDTARDSAVVASIALGHGIPADALQRALIRNGSGTASGPLGTLLDRFAAEDQSDGI